MTKQDFALKYESGEFDNEETPQRVQKELDNRSRALFGMKTPKKIQSPQTKPLKTLTAKGVLNLSRKKDKTADINFFNANVNSQKRIKVQASAKVFSDTQTLDDEILKEVLGIHQGNVALIETVEKAIALTRKKYGKEDNQTYVKGYKNGQKAERQRILAIVVDYLSDDEFGTLKKEVIKDDRT